MTRRPTPMPGVNSTPRPLTYVRIHNLERIGMSVLGTGTATDYGRP